MPVRLKRHDVELAELRERLAAAEAAAKDHEGRLAAVEAIAARAVAVVEANRGKPLARLLGLK